ncbi:hypothetical protein LZ30DRAFT_775987 [Colletotrichum cereale]|nr:hypothetical protein LZ30DRAFT_775987 [Colletotrichum cereale]
MTSAHVGPPPYYPKYFPQTIQGTPTVEEKLKSLVDSGMMEWGDTKEWTNLPNTGPDSNNIYVAEQNGNQPRKFFLVRRTMERTRLGVLILESTEKKTIKNGIVKWAQARNDIIGLMATPIQIKRTTHRTLWQLDNDKGRWTFSKGSLEAYGNYEIPKGQASSWRY